MTRNTALAWELAWEFVELVSIASMTFSGFCRYMTSVYRRNFPDSRAFMDNKTFTKSWFGWASCLSIEFRTPCKWCGWDPPILAGDGTAVGFPKSRADISPVEKRQDIAPIQTPHRRNDRTFLKNADQRIHLKYICDKFRNDNMDFLAPEVEIIRTRALIDCCPDECKAALDVLLQQQGTLEQLQSLAALFRLLSYEASLTALLPVMAVPALSNYLEGNFDQAELLRILQKCCPELGRVVQYFGAPVLPADVKSLLKHIVERVVTICNNSPAPEPADPIPGSYDPGRLGRFYYFRPDGCQIRSGRPFSIDRSSGPNAEFDDRPDVGICSKQYIKAPSRGSTFLFTWLCPSHGHCYGAHVVSGGEGRKDPSFSLFTHKETAPLCRIL